jgi:hypothetical protein
MELLLQEVQTPSSMQLPHILTLKSMRLKPHFQRARVPEVPRPNLSLKGMTMRFFCAVLLSVAGTIAAIVVAAPAAAKNFPVVGGQGPHSIVVGCTVGEYIVGFKGRIGSWIDRIGPLCAPLLPSMELGEKRYPASYGGNGGSPNQAFCESGEVVQGISADSLSAEPNYLRSVKFLCGSTTNSYQIWHGEAGSGGGFEASWDNSMNLSYVLLQTCPKGEWAWGIGIRYGQYVNALGLMCRKPDLPTAPPPPKPDQAEIPPLPPVPPPVAGTTWKHFAGAWDTSVQPDKKIRLEMAQQGSFVQGNYTGDGRLTGRVVGNELTFNWTQPGGSGTGHFFIADDENSFSGTFSTAADPNRFLSWGGRKVK